jgi:type IV secretory pathway VirB6-like protein
MVFNWLRLITDILLVVIIILFLYITPIALEDKELYKECDIKVLCSKNLVNKDLCPVNNTYNINFTIG